MLPVIIIPAYQPDTALLTLVDRLLANQAEQKIIVVNDGSTGAATTIFPVLEQLSNVSVLHHPVNLGKGQALKTAFQYVLNNYTHDHVGVITADADGQHAVEDIERLSASFRAAPHHLWLGSRRLKHDAPWRSRLGNGFMRKIFKLLVRHNIHDTQTGLRGIPIKLLAGMTEIPAPRYEFEMAALIYALRNKVTIVELPIQVIYIDANKHSHFRPLKDSWKVCQVLFSIPFQ